MTMVFREKIHGTVTDFDLWALNGIIAWQIDDSDDMNQEKMLRYIDEFEKCNPYFKLASVEFLYS